MKRHFTLLLLLVGLVSADPAVATTIALSGVSSDGTPASQLDGELEFGVAGSTLTLTVTNTGSDFTINQVYWNAAANVTGLSLVSATHDVEGDVASAWSLETAERAGGFGRFDFAVVSQGGAEKFGLIEPGEEVVFVFAISGTGPFDTDDFVLANNRGFEVAAKFVSGPPDPECANAVVPTPKCPQGVFTEDSGFGAVPEPAAGLLVTLGLGAVLGRRALRA